MPNFDQNYWLQRGWTPHASEIPKLQSIQAQSTGIPYSQGQFAGTPYDRIQQFLGGQWQGAVQGGNKSAQTEYGRQLDDLFRFFSIMGGGPNEQFDIAKGNINRAMGQAVGQTQQTAAAQAGARGFLNPSAFITGAGSQARSPYVQALGGLEGQRAQAQQAFLAQILQYLTGQGGQRAQRNAEIEAQTPNALDWISGLAPIALAPFTGGTSLAAYAGMGGGGRSSPFSNSWNPSQYINPNNAINRPLPF